MSSDHVKSIQCWPGGDSFHYRGDVDGPPDQRRVKKHTDAEWRDGTSAEWRQIAISARAEMYQRSMIYVNQTMLVEELIRDEHTGFLSDDIRNLATNAEIMDAQECRDWLTERGIDWNSGPTDPCAECDGDGQTHNPSESLAPIPCATCEGAGETLNPDGDEDPEYLADLRELVSDHGECVDILEWYLVDSWLCGELDAVGEPTLDNDYGYWWGRTCSGQGLIMDGTLQRIAAKRVGR